MNDILNSLVRTWAPMIVGALVVLIPDVDTTALNIVVAQMLYYGLARAAEYIQPKAGVLLGSPKAPAYDGTH